MPIDITIIRGILESLNFIATIVLACIAIYGIKQISLMKADMNSRSERAAKEKAIEASLKYFNEFIPLIDLFDNKVNKKRLPCYKGPIGDFSEESIPNEFYSTSRKRLDIDELRPPLNCLEGISAMLTTGVADEQVAFDIFGRSLCRAVASMYDIISICHSDIASPYYQNIVKLYQIWSPRLSQSELETARNRIDTKLSSIETKTIPALHPKIK